MVNHPSRGSHGAGAPVRPEELLMTGGSSRTLDFCSRLENIIEKGQQYQSMATSTLSSSPIAPSPSSTLAIERLAGISTTIVIS